MTLEVEQPVEPIVKPVENKLTVLEKEMGKLNTLVSAGYFEAICPEGLPELHRQGLMSQDFLTTKRIEAMLNRISTLKRVAGQIPELSTQALETAASISKLIEIELSELPSTKLAPEQLAIAANGNMGELLETATRLGLPELIDPARFPLLGSLSSESLALLRSEAYVRLIQRLKEIRGEIAEDNIPTGFLSEGSSGVLAGIDQRITNYQQALLELNKK